MKPDDLIYVRARVVGFEADGKIVVEWDAPVPNDWHAVVPLAAVVVSPLKLTTEEFTKIVDMVGDLAPLEVEP